MAKVCSLQREKSVQFDSSINLHWELHYERVSKPSRGQVLRSELASEDMSFFFHEEQKIDINLNSEVVCLINDIEGKPVNKC